MSTLHADHAVRPGLAEDPDLGALVRRALDGDPAALTWIVQRFDRFLRAVVRFYRLSPCDVDDVVQATWLQFIEHGRTLREPAAVKGWLATTARRQSLRVLQRRVREQPSDDPALGEDLRVVEPHEELIAAERRATLYSAVARLPVPSRRLMTLMIARPGMSYEQVGEALGIPVGSIGPTRLRCISRLSQMREIRALRDSTAVCELQGG
jgi:RNA polymerase sigma factor (sigma-70 family)